MFKEENAVTIREFSYTKSIVCDDGSTLENKFYVDIIQRGSTGEGWIYDVIQQVNGVIMSQNTWDRLVTAEMEFNQFVLSALNNNNHFYEYTSKRV